MKECFKCGKKKELSQFYKHSGMADGYLNKCKECTQVDVLKNRYKRLDYYRAYDRGRYMQPERVEARLNFSQSEEGKHCARLASARWVALNREKRLAVCKKYRDANKEKIKAQGKVSTALDNGRLIRGPCNICGNKKSHAHHHDYSKPLEVEWLCAQCHKDEHKRLNGHN